VRSFEHRSAESAKFWQVSQEGVAVTVQFGRVGTTGQTRVKELATEEAASLHMAGLITEKVKKGYLEVASAAGPVQDGPVGLPDEDTFVLPDVWVRRIRPRRGGRPVARPPSLAGAAAKADAILTETLDHRERVLADRSSEPDLVAAARAFLDGSRITPLGAAATAWASWDVFAHPQVKAAVADGWVAAHGLAFAAQAVLELSGLQNGYGGHLGRNERISYWLGAPWRLAAERVRARLAVADDAAYAQARQAVEAYRSTRQHMLAAFLLPTEPGWLGEDCPAELRDDSLAAFVVSTPQEWERISHRVRAFDLAPSLGLLATVLDVIGPTVGARLLDLVGKNGYSEERRAVFNGLTLIPTDEAFEALVRHADDDLTEPALLEAAERFPVRALRLLGRAADAPDSHRRITELLHRRVTANPEIVRAALPVLPEASRRQIEPILASLSTLPPAPAELLHLLLATPPWTRARTVVKPIVVDGLTPPDVTRVCRLSGEREAELAQFEREAPLSNPEQWERTAANLREGRPQHPADEEKFFTDAPRSMTDEFLARWRPTDFWSPRRTMPRLLARFDVDAVPVLVHNARLTEQSDLYGPLLLPAEGLDVATLMAEWLGGGKSARRIAVSWLRQHPDSAARELMPAAIGPAGPPRRAAEQALRAVAAGHEDVVRDAAVAYGPAAATAVDALLSIDPAEILPKRMPDLPPWAADTAALAPILLRGRRHALPEAAVRHLCTMLALSRIGTPYPGVAIVRETLDRASLAEFGWSLFQSWESAGRPPKQSWALEALALTGDDDTVRRLAPIIRAWPGEGGHARAVTGLDVLREIGSEVALMHLHSIAQKVKFAGLKYAAQERIDVVAGELGFTAEQLADRLVPDFGLDARGRLTLDYGPRRFVVGFDEHLRPYVVDDDGMRRKDLPKPGARDDETLATAAYKTYAGLKKDVRTVAADLIHRLETAMVVQRRWTADEFRRLLVEHPLMRHVVSRLVWATFTADGTVGTAFRVAEDGSPADVDDKEFALADDASVGVAHPLHIEADLTTWERLFADYEILQPFLQLQRPVRRLTAEQAAQQRLTEFVGANVAVDRLLKLERRGWWERSTPMDAGIQDTVECYLPGPGGLTFPLDPGISVQYPNEDPVQTFRDARLSGAPNFAALDPVILSELLCDLHYLVHGGAMR
jgi:predicted DNA-binding WGR domain protein